MHFRSNVRRDFIFLYGIVKMPAAVDPDFLVQFIHGLIDALLAPVFYVDTALSMMSEGPGWKYMWEVGF